MATNSHPNRTATCRGSERRKATCSAEFSTRSFMPNADPKWNAVEEIVLLESIRKYGYDWKRITKELKAESPGKEFSFLEVGEHFEETYTLGEMAKVWDPGMLSEIEDEIGIFEHNVECFDYTCDDPGPVYIQDLAASANLPVEYTELISYYPERCDFLHELDKKLDAMVKDVEITDADDEFSKKMKMSMLFSYVNIQKERTLLRNLIVTHRLTELFFYDGDPVIKQLRLNGIMPKIDCDEDIEWMLSLCRYFSPAEFQKFYDNILKERKLRTEILQLEDMKTCMEIDLQETMQSEFLALKKNESLYSMASEPPSNFNMLEYPINPNKGYQMGYELTGSFTQQTPTETALLYEKIIELNNLLSVKKSSLIPAQSSKKQKRKPKTIKKPLSEEEISFTPLSDSDIESATQLRTYENPPFSKLPGYDSLSNEEKRMCAMQQLRPVYYIGYKLSLQFINETLRQKGIKGSSVEYKSLFPDGFSKRNCIKIMKFLLETKILRTDYLLRFVKKHAGLD